MRRAKGVLASKTDAIPGDRKWMKDALHDLCQPLTALECRLYLGSIGYGGGAEAEEMRTAMREGLLQCERMITQVRGMQDRLNGTLGEGS